MAEIPWVFFFLLLSPAIAGGGCCSAYMLLFVYFSAAIFGLLFNAYLSFRFNFFFVLLPAAPDFPEYFFVSFSWPIIISFCVLEPGAGILATHATGVQLLFSISRCENTYATSAATFG